MPSMTPFAPGDGRTTPGVRRPHITVVAAARPNFMKVGPVLRALEGRADTRLVHTGQH